jgi:MFS family permease
LLSDHAMNKKILRKIDFSIMPLLCGTYFLQYIDKQALSYAAVFDLFKTTHTTSNQYSWLVSIFYFAYLFAEWPSSYLAQRYSTGLIVGSFVVAWGSILLITASCSNFTGLAICRFLLGCFESVVTPCFMLIVSMWYTKAEQPSRAGLFYCFNGFGSMVGGILFYGVGFERHFPVWKVIFLLCGSVTVIWGAFLLYFLPSKVTTAKRFTPEERALVIARTHQNRTGLYNRKIKFEQIKEALLDPQVWLLFLYVLLNETINGGLGNFGKLIVKGVAHGDSLLTTAYGIPQGAFQVLFVFSGPFIASKVKNSRMIVMAIYLCPTIIGTTLLWKLPRSNTVGCLLSYYIVCFSHFPPILTSYPDLPFLSHITNDRHLDR